MAPRFGRAPPAFFDPSLTAVDAGRKEGARDAVIGMDLRSRLLYVVHIVLEDDHIRIISARYATRTGRAVYEG